MIFIKYSILLLLIFSDSTTCNNKTSEEIMNGHFAELGEFPYMVSIQLRYRNLHFCGGTLITNQHVLTAAHCFFASLELVRGFPASELQVRAGLINRKKIETFRDKRYVRQLFIHEEFSNHSIDNDIAILVLFSPRFQLSSYLQTAILSYEFIDQETVRDKFCYIIGWGRRCGTSVRKTLFENFDVNELLDNNDMNATILNNVLHTITGAETDCGYDKDILLQYAKIKLEKISECEADYPIENPDKVLCAGTRGSKIDACKGDSGGPLICDGILEGIISFGDGCDKPNHLGGYTRVFHHLEWIEDIISKSSIKISKLSSIFYILSILMLLKIN